MIEEALNNLEILKTIGITIKANSWIHEAINHAKLTNEHLENGTLEEFTSNNATRWKTTVVFGNLSEFSLIMSQVNELLNLISKIFIKKLKEIMNMPLKVSEENAKAGTNQGRNTLFELRLSARLSTAGYYPILSFDHPDISLNIGNNRYAIECKRVFLEETFLALTKEAIKQLNDYSLKNDSDRIGIVAVSITRAFHAGDMKLYAENMNGLGELAEIAMEKFIKKYSDFFNKEFPENIPAIILDFSDFAEAEKPYWLHWLYIVTIGANPDKDKLKTVVNDLKNLNKNDQIN